MGVGAGGGGFSESTSSQDSQSYSGLRGTNQFPEFAKGYSDLAAKGFQTASDTADSRYGYFQGKSADELTPTVNGLPPEVTMALQGYGNKMFANASAGGAMTGNLQPQNTSGIVGGALQNIGQFLAPLITEFSKYKNYLPEQLKMNRLGYLMSPLSASAPGLGSSSTYHGESQHVGMSGGGPGSAPGLV